MPERLGFFNSAVMIALVAAITFMLRAAPFALFGGRRKTPAVIIYLGGVLPPAIIAALVVYCLRSTDFTVHPYGLPGIAAVIVVALLHIWRKNTLLSILGGTVLYMTLIRVV